MSNEQPLTEASRYEIGTAPGHVADPLSVGRDTELAGRAGQPG